MARTALRVVTGGPVQTVTIERHLVVGAAMNARSLAREIATSLNAIEQRMWAGNRAGVVNEIGRAHHRIEELEAAFLELAGIADRNPSDPSQAAKSAAA